MFQNSSFKKGRNVFKFSPENECILVHLGQLTKLRFQSQVDFGLKILLKKKHKRWINGHPSDPPSSESATTYIATSFTYYATTSIAANNYCNLLHVATETFHFKNKYTKD